jgi:glycosyltransferase involved in cell wall biosynthesis
VANSVSVVIPCYNYGSFLGECVRSATEAQPGVDVEVLIIDDASSDDSADVARHIAAADPRVEVIVHATNRGHIATYNEGLLEWARGDFSVLLSADDQLTPGALHRAVSLLQANPTVGFAYGHPLHFRHGAALPTPRTKVRGWSVWPGHWWLQRRFRDATSCITSPEVVVRTGLQKQVGGYDPRLTHCGDIEMWMRLAAYSDVGYVRGVDQAFYRVHGRNMSSSTGRIEDLRQRRDAYDAVIARCADVLPDREKWSDDVHERLAWEALSVAARAYDRGRVATTPVDDLVAFALDCWPDATELPIYRGLQLRKRIGPNASKYLQPFAISAVTNKAQNWWWWQSWQRRGI